MASISSLLNTIKNAIYGRDMRSAIHDSIEAVNDDAESRLSKSGDTMTGDISMGDNKVTSSAHPSEESDYTNKKYVDDIAKNKVDKTDYATENKAGVIKIGRGLSYNSDTGIVWIHAASISDIDNRDDQFKPIVSSDLNYVVKAALSDEKRISMTDKEKTNARDVIGAASQADIDTKQDTLTFDDTPTQGSSNPVKSNGLYNTLKDYAKKSDIADVYKPCGSQSSEFLDDVGRNGGIDVQVGWVYNVYTNNSEGKDNILSAIRLYETEFYPNITEASITSEKTVKITFDNAQSALEFEACITRRDFDRLFVQDFQTNDGYLIDTANVDDNTLCILTITLKTAIDDYSSQEIGGFGSCIDVSDGDNIVWTEYGWDKLSATIDLSDYIKNTDYATADKAGLVKPLNAGGLRIYPDGTLTLQSAPYAEITERTTDNPQAITPRNLNFAVKAALSDENRISDMTDEEKANARDVIGVKTKPDIDYMASSYPPGTVGITVAANKIYNLGKQTSVTITLPALADYGDFIQVDFISGSTASTLTIQSTAGLSDYDLTPEANTIYSLYFDWGILDSTSVEGSMETTVTYGWRFGYSEYTKTVGE